MRGDEADPGLAAEHLPVARRPAGAVAAGQQLEALRDPLAHLVAGAQGVLALMAGDAAQRHLLDEADVQLVVDGEGHQVLHLVVVAALLHHAVELDALEPGAARHGDAVQHLVELVATGEGGEAFALQRIEADVQAGDPGGTQVAGHGGQLRTVGGDRQVVQLAARAEAAEQVEQVLAHQRLAAGDANAFDAEADEGVRHRVEFFEGKDLRPRREDHVLAHAVRAAEVATIGDRQAQVGDAPAKGVEQSVVLHLVVLPQHAPDRDPGGMDGWPIKTEEADFVYRFSCPTAVRLRG
ncbi:hypothetical protein D9M69_391110 [compost metagenome]